MQNIFVNLLWFYFLVWPLQLSPARARVSVCANPGELGMGFLVAFQDFILWCCWCKRTELNNYDSGVKMLSQHISLGLNRLKTKKESTFLWTFFSLFFCDCATNRKLCCNSALISVGYGFGPGYNRWLWADCNFFSYFCFKCSWLNFGYLSV